MSEYRINSYELKFKYSTADIVCTVTGPSRGFRDSLGVPEEPDEPGYVEIESVSINGIDITEVVNIDDLANHMAEYLL